MTVIGPMSGRKHPHSREPVGRHQVFEICPCRQWRQQRGGGEMQAKGVGKDLLHREDQQSHNSEVSQVTYSILLQGLVCAARQLSKLNKGCRT